MGHEKLQMTARYVSNSDEAHLKAVNTMEKNLKKLLGEGDESED
jgi:hypothetical protein